MLPLFLFHRLRNWGAESLVSYIRSHSQSWASTLMIGSRSHGLSYSTLSIFGKNGACVNVLSLDKHGGTLCSSDNHLFFLFLFSLQQTYLFVLTVYLGNTSDVSRELSESFAVVVLPSVIEYSVCNPFTTYRLFPFVFSLNKCWNMHSYTQNFI